MHKLLCLISIALAGCATAYKDASRWEYVGNDNFLISSFGNGYTHGYSQQAYLLIAAAEACDTEKHLGYKIVNRDNASVDPQNYTLLVHCEGAQDPIIMQKIAKLKNESKTPSGKRKYGDPSQAELDARATASQ